MLIYGQDQWTLKRMTLNAGLRFDYLRYVYPDHNSPPTQWVPVARVFSGSEVLNWKSVSPRLGASHDLFGNGKTAIKASLGNYVLADGLPRRTSINPLQQNNSDARTWNNVNKDFVVHGDPLNPLANGELGPSTNASFGQAAVTAKYDPAWATGFGKRADNWEMSTGFSTSCSPAWR
jgi:hypothetical protein